MFTFILAFSAGLNEILKHLFVRPRPQFMPLINEPSYSFPSGHSMNSFVFYTCLAYFIFSRVDNRTYRRLLYFLSAAIILLIGISRIYLGAHYPSDVLAGYAAGALWFFVVTLFEKTQSKHSHTNSE